MGWLSWNCLVGDGVFDEKGLGGFAEDAVLSVVHVFELLLCFSSEFLLGFHQK